MSGSRNLQACWVSNLADCHVTFVTLVIWEENWSAPSALEVPYGICHSATWELDGDTCDETLGTWHMTGRWSYLLFRGVMQRRSLVKICYLRCYHVGNKWWTEIKVLRCLEWGWRVNTPKPTNFGLHQEGQSIRCCSLEADWHPAVVFLPSVVLSSCEILTVFYCGQLEQEVDLPRCRGCLTWGYLDVKREVCLTATPSKLVPAVMTRTEA